MMDQLILIEKIRSLMHGELVTSGIDRDIVMHELRNSLNPVRAAEHVISKDLNLGKKDREELAVLLARTQVIMETVFDSLTPLSK